MKVSLVIASAWFILLRDLAPYANWIAESRKRAATIMKMGMLSPLKGILINKPTGR